MPFEASTYNVTIFSMSSRLPGSGGRQEAASPARGPAGHNRTVDAAMATGERKFLLYMPIISQRAFYT